jgi:hypothetical protein
MVVNSRLVAAPVIMARATEQLDAEVAGAGRLTLRIACDPGPTAVTFSDRVLFR